MSRTDDDSWDTATSVGSTAVMVAAARAAETAKENPLIRDEFAQMLIDGPELSDLMSRMSATFAGDAGLEATYRHMVDYQAARTHFFDAFFTAAADAGIRQHVILAAGLDSRAYRLDWPAGTAVYEVDQPKVLAYKAGTLATHGAQPSAARREVPADLRFDWPKTLRDAGFDPARPTAWPAEGLLPFLPGDAQDRMFADIDSLSAPGSRIAVENFGVDDTVRDGMARQRARVEQLRERLGDENVFDPGELWYLDDHRSEPADWFVAHGWRAGSVVGGDYLAQLGRPVPSSVDEQLPFGATFVTAEKAA
jgi:methyltransferase (TIGR00027 family)